MIRSSSLLLAFAFGLCLLSQAVDARGRRGHNKVLNKENQRDGKVLSLFNIVTFDNDPCTSNAKTGSGTARNGTCLTSSECKDKSGTHSGNCAAGFGVCCVFTVENSGDTITQNCSYIRNPGFPATYSGTETRFTHTVNKCSCDVCFIRLDFEAFTLLGTADTQELTGGVCQDTFTVTGQSGQNVPTICGQNSGKHMYIETGQGCSDSVTLTSAFTGAATTRRWDIKVSQIECTNALVPPQGCLEYMTTATGRVTSFNWENTGETHLASQDQKVCFRSTKNTCCVRYTLCNDPLAYKFSGDMIDANPADPMSIAMTNSECTADYIEAQRFTPDCYPNGPSTQGVTKLCGGVFNTQTANKIPMEAICDCSPALAITFVTDAASEVPGIAPAPDTKNLNSVNKGLCLDYSLINC